MKPNDGKPQMPTTPSSGCTRTQKVVANTVAVVGVVMVLLGLVHFAGVPLILEANKSGAINLPSIELYFPTSSKRGKPQFPEKTSISRNLRRVSCPVEEPSAFQWLCRNAEKSQKTTNSRVGRCDKVQIEEKGIGFHLVREQVANGILMVGVDRCVFGAILLLCVPELRKGRKIAWRICVVIGLLTFVGYTALVWLIFDHFHLVPFVMPVMGLLILVPLSLARRSFTAE